MSTSVPNPISETASSYDETPYPSSAFPQTHPNRLAAMARLFGLAASDPAKARVLELGCADGSNLLPMAESLPDATFIGIDSSKVEIANGLKTVETTGLKNVELRQQDLLDFPATEGKFDYIIAHGVYSWVPAAVRDKLLALCAEHLTENGVAYVSYNAQPGWNLRRSIREMMLFHLRNFPGPKTKVQQARALIGFLAESVPTEKNAYGLLLKSELDHLNRFPDSFLLHDVLSEENTAFYLHEFIGSATQHGLQYLSESSFSEMLAANFPEKVRQTLGQLNKNIVAQEQYMDFLRNRSFRQTLLCRAGASLRRNIETEAMPRFAFRSLLRNATGPIELVPGISITFTTAAGVQVSSSDAFVKAALWTLTETLGVAAISYRDLLDIARSRSRAFLGEIPPDRNEIDESTLRSNLINLLARGLVEIYADPVRVRMDVPEKPVVSAVARCDAVNARLITNRLHQPIPADAISRPVIAACDGTRTRDDLVAVLAEQVANGKLQVNEGGQKVTDTEKLKNLLKPTADKALASIAASGFFAP